MEHTTIKIQGATGGTLDKSNLGFNPAYSNLGNCQVSVTGLNGSTFTVKVRPVNSTNFVIFEANVGEDDIVLAKDILFDAIKVEYNGVASTVAFCTFITRGI